MRKLIVPVLLVMLFLPYFWRPFALNLNPDVGLQMMDVFRMIDARWSLSIDPSAAYANPIVQMLVDFHGIFRQLIYFPVFYVLDFFGMGIREATVYGTLLVVGIFVTYLNYLFARVLVGGKKAFWFTTLLSVIPFYVLQVKGGWWHMFVYLFLLAGLAAEHVILRRLAEGSHIAATRRIYALFCLAASLYLLADTGFVFGGLLYVLYAVIFFWQKAGFRAVFGNLWRTVRSPWTLLPLLVLAGSFVVTYIGKIRFGAEFGIMARFLEKGGHVGFTGLGVVPHFISQGMGLTGLVLFPIMLLAAIWVLCVVILRLQGLRLLGPSGTHVEESHNDPFFFTLVTYFFATLFLLLLAGGSGASVYELYIPGLILLVYAFSYLKKVWIQNVFMIGIIAVTFAQTVAYNFEMKPPEFLAQPRSFIRANDACTALWCPWHFAEPKNLGVTTAAFALRDYLGIMPIPFTSMQENFYDKPKEIFFYSNYGQGPSMSIGRRISYVPEDIAAARVILVFTPQALERAKTAADNEKNQAVWDFVRAHLEYKEVATVTQGGAEMIKVFERDSIREPRVFSVEEYDAKFNERYGHLRDIGFIDLG